MGDYVKQFVLYPLIYSLCKMLNIVFHGTLCTTESQPHRGRDVKKKKDVITCEKRGGKKLSMSPTRSERKGRKERERERRWVGGGDGVRADRVA